MPKYSNSFAYCLLFSLSLKKSSMAFRKMIPLRVSGMSRMTNSALTNCRTSSPRTAVKSAALNHQSAMSKPSHDHGEDGIFRRYLHRQSAATPAAFRFLPTGERLLEKLREMDTSRDRIRLEGLRPPAPENSLSVADVKKILKLTQLEMVKSKLSQIEKDFVSYPEFLEICCKECSSTDQGLEYAKILDESGSVIVLGNIVFIRPEQEIETIVVKAIEGLLPISLNSDDNPRMKELQEFEKQKAEIDMKAKSCARRELWSGLGGLVFLTASFMRLTFWELTWDVMEPICFFATSSYFIIGYAFFLRTSKEPTFESFFQSRFSSKQKKLMKAHKFDVERYNELKKACPQPRAFRESAVASNLSGS